MIYPDFNELLDLQHKARKLRSLKDKTSSDIVGNNASKRYGAGLEFEEVREYAFGDDVRNIDWRVTARTGKPYSKLFKVESEQTINIVVDMNSNMHFGTKKTFKSIQAAQCVSLISWFFNTLNNKVGGIIFGSVKEDIAIYHPSKSKQSLLKLLQDLTIKKVCLKDIKLDKALSKLGRMATMDSRIYVISDFSNFDYSAILKDIKRLKEKGCKITFIQIIDQRDYEMPAIGHISFLDFKGALVSIDTNNKKGREKYRALWQENQKKLKRIVNKMAIKFIQIKTQDDVYLKLLGKI